MVQIIKNYTSLKKYQQTVKNNPEELKPNSCDICGCNNIWCNGLYERSISSRDKERNISEGVDILRFKCSKCKNHYSVLPSLIPLLRWYLWCMQQWVLSMILGGFSKSKAAEAANIDRRTVSRWYSWINNKWKIIYNTICQVNTNFKKYYSLKTFSSLFIYHNLSNIAEILHQENLLIPY